jgi:hypothetical protein
VPPAHRKSRHDDSPYFQPLRRQFGSGNIAPAFGGFHPGSTLTPQLDRLIDLQGRRFAPDQIQLLP